MINGVISIHLHAYLAVLCMQLPVGKLLIYRYNLDTDICKLSPLYPKDRLTQFLSCIPPGHTVRNCQWLRCYQVFQLDYSMNFIRIMNSAPDRVVWEEQFKLIKSFNSVWWLWLFALLSSIFFYEYSMHPFLILLMSCWYKTFTWFRSHWSHRWSGIQ